MFGCVLSGEVFLTIPIQDKISKEMSNIKCNHGSITTNNKCVVSSDVPGKPLFKRCAWRGSQKLCMGHGREGREGSVHLDERENG